MVTVCAWCEKYMGSKEPFHDPSVSHGICPDCVEVQTLREPPVVVVSRARVGTIPLLQTLLRGAPDVSIVVDRRTGERRNGNGNGHHPPAVLDRRLDDRRRRAGLFVV